VAKAARREEGLVGCAAMAVVDVACAAGVEVILASVEICQDGPLKPIKFEGRFWSNLFDRG